MKVFESLNFNEEELTRFLEEKAKSHGLLSRSKTENLEYVDIVHRPFTKVTLNLESLKGSEQYTSISYIDEWMSSVVSERDHRLLLWRPRYANLMVLDREEVKQESHDDASVEAIQSIIDELILYRWNGQELDDELVPKLRSLQADPLSVIALIVPRSPFGLKREEKLIQERKELHSFVFASSLMTNCSPKDIIVSSVIGDSVSVKTVVARYRNVSTDEVRLSFLELSGASSLSDAQKQGGALSRACQLYDCYEFGFKFT
ncbi:MAG: hypothetical protein ACFFE2_08995 [Candidatus Thorarchaeota archaeon]